MNCPQHHHTFSFLKIFKVASDEADPPFHSSLFTPTRRLHFERKHSFPASAKLPPKPSQPLLNLVWWNKYQGNIFRLILLLQTVLLLRAMSLHRQPHEEQEEIFSTILSSFSSLAATSPSFSSCFPEHSEINSALLLLKVRRGTWLRKGCTEPPADLHFGIRWFFVKINGQWIVEMFSQCDYVTPLSNRLFRAVERYFSSKSSPFVNFIFLHPLIWWFLVERKTWKASILP